MKDALKCDLIQSENPIAKRPFYLILRHKEGGKNGKKRGKGEGRKKSNLS